jgi:hypothetical protein
MKRTSRFVEYVNSRIGTSCFTLIDVGCGGGLHPVWDALGDRLTGFGFDPNIEEIQRLRLTARRSFRYELAFVGLPMTSSLRSLRKGRGPWSRTRGIA